MHLLLICDLRFTPVEILSLSDVFSDGTAATTATPRVLIWGFISFIIGGFRNHTAAEGGEEGWEGLVQVKERANMVIDETVIARKRVSSEVKFVESASFICADKRTKL